MIIFLHDENSKDSREFKAVVMEAEKNYKIIDWNTDNYLKTNYEMLDYPNPSKFPFLYDTETKNVAGRPASIEDAEFHLNGLGTKPKAVTTLRKQINKTTDNIIINNFYYDIGADHVQFILTPEFQTTLLNCKIKADADALPIGLSIKGRLEGEFGTNYYYWEPANAAEVLAFYDAGEIHILTSLAAGWALKDGGGSYTPLKDKTLEELQAFTDPRV